MIYVILGDDVSGSREKFQSMRKDYQSKNYEIIDINENSLIDLEKWQWNAQNLFAQDKVFFIQNILAKKKNRELLKNLDTQKSKTDIVVWEEELWERDVKYALPGAKILNIKLPQNVFTLLDNLFPGKKTLACSLLPKICENTEELVLFSMIAKRIKELVLVKMDIDIASKQSWQLSRLKNQADMWDKKRLIKFYDSLYKIDVNAKSTNSPYSITENLSILFCYYL